jgi:hypothetical protein
VEGVIKRLSIAILAAVTLAACSPADTDVPPVEAASAVPSAALVSAEPLGLVATWEVRTLNAAPARFRPGGWSSETVLWGTLGGRVASVDVGTGAVRALRAEAWSVAAARGVVSWRNAEGTWILRDGAEPVRVAAGEHPSGFEGPPGLVWSPDGERVVLVWGAEWDSRHQVLDRDGSIRDLETVLPGYFLNDAAVWLDPDRILFRTVAMGPVGGEPEYRESGWRGDLAVLALGTGDYHLVTQVPDHTYLHVGGLIPGGVLVTAWTAAAAPPGYAGGGHVVYEPDTWEGGPIPLPAGRAFGSVAGAIIVFLDRTADIDRAADTDPGDVMEAVLIAAGDAVFLGRVAMDAEPVFSPAGRRAALRTVDGRLLLMAAVD